MSNKSNNKPEEYDLVGQLASFLDLHMMFPLISYLQTKDIYNKDDLDYALVEIVRPTLMFDYMIELMGEEGSDPTDIEEISRKRDDTVAELEELNSFVTPLQNIIQESGNQMIQEGTFNLDVLENEYDITEDVISAYERLGKVSYETGSYAETIEIMKYSYELTENPENLWGKLAAESLTLMATDDVVNAVMDIFLLFEKIERTEATSQNHPLEQLQRRSWLLHWSLFTFFKSGIEDAEDADIAPRDDGAPSLAKDLPKYQMTKMIEFFFKSSNLNAIQTNCPHLLRYLTVMVICSDKKSNIDHLVSVIRQEQYNYRDPITMFVECLYVTFDFQAAQEKLQECEIVLSNDYFLEHLKDVFLECAKKAMFDIYCRIHTKIDTNMLATRLGMQPEDAELWIVNLIRDAKLDAKIDSEHNRVVMSQSYPDVYQKLQDKSKDLALRSYQLVSDIKASEQNS